MIGLAHELVGASLAAFAALPAWLRTAMDGEHVGACLRRRYEPELAEHGLALVSCRAERVRAVGEKWYGRYELTVREPDGELRDLVLIGRLWHPSSLPTATVDIGANGHRFGEHGWQTWLPEVGLELRVQSSDECLPALPTLLTPQLAAQAVETALRMSHHPDARVVSCVPHVLRYKPGSRCTVLADVGYAADGAAPAPPGTVVLKTHSRHKGRFAWEAMDALWQRRQAWQEAVTLAEPLAYLEQENVLVQTAVAKECTLKELVRDAMLDPSEQRLATLRDELARSARALAAVHTSGAVYPWSTTFEAELANVDDQVAALSRSAPRVETAAGPLLRRLAEIDASVPADPLVAAHRDFSPGQVLVYDGTVGIVDFDDACMAEPALDLARFRAKLRDTGMHVLARGGQPASGDALDRSLRLTDELCDHFLDAYREHADVSSTRLEMWEACQLFIMLLHAWTKALDYRVAPRLAVLRHRLAHSTV
jgi:thiamine kinase-like enzyme